MGANVSPEYGLLPYLAVISGTGFKGSFYCLVASDYAVSSVGV